MRQFYEACRGDEKVSPLVAQLSWTHHLLILGRAKRPEERDFYLRFAVRERWTKRELERQMNAALFERAVLDPPKTAAALRAAHPLVFYHRELQALIALELKATEFEPSHMGQLAFYLEALDRDVRKPHERPSIGVLLCASKNAEVVEYALARTLSPALVAEYARYLPDKRLLEGKLAEFVALAEAETARDEAQEGAVSVVASDRV